MNSETLKRKPMKVIGTAIDCENADALANFYVQLLGWQKTYSGDGVAVLSTPEYPALLVFQEVEYYTKPVWPWAKDKQAQMMHFDFLVDDLDEAVEHAKACGAIVSEVQYFDTSTTMLDPAGHPFCLSTVLEDSLYAK